MEKVAEINSFRKLIGFIKNKLKTNLKMVYSDESYWEERWKVNSIGFHKADNHPFVFDPI